ncbi:MAG: hypothetical protein OSJ38_11330 [Lachnospiraceae bacterium]|nr:hypothetical protein [Lachnospiraceae bacterium]
MEIIFNGIREGAEYISFCPVLCGCALPAIKWLVHVAAQKRG